MKFSRTTWFLDLWYENVCVQILLKFEILLFPLSVTDESSTTILANENDFKVLTSPSYPNSYPDNAEVTFVILSPEGTNVKLDFLDLDIQESWSQAVLYIYDGKSQDPIKMCQLPYKNSSNCTENSH